MATGPSREERFRAIVLRFQPQVLGFFSRRGFSAEDSQDLAQDTFLRVYRRMEGIREQLALPRWIFIVATNIYRNELRRRQAAMRDAVVLPLEAEERKLSLLDRISTDDGASLERVLATERRKMLREAVASLPARMRQCVLLYLDQELKYREIAELLQISVETVKVQLYQARSRLKAALREHFSGIDSNGEEAP